MNFPATKQITLASFPGERAVLATPLVYMRPGGDNQTMQDLDVVGTAANAPTIQVDGNGDALVNLDVTNTHLAESCIDVGYYKVTGFTLSDSNIHGCGKLVDGNHDHGIYIEGVDGGTISGNTFSDNYGGWDVQAWPHANVTVEGNVMRSSTLATEGGLVVMGGNATDDTSGTGTTNLVVQGNVMVGNGKAYMFDTDHLNSGAVTLSGNCLVPNGSPIYSGALSGGGTVYATQGDAEAACLGTPTPTPTPSPTPTATPTPTPTPTGTVAALICPHAAASTGTTWVRFTYDNLVSTDTSGPPWTGTCRSVTPGVHALGIDTNLGVSDSVTITRP